MSRATKKRKKPVAFKVGDLVQLNEFWGNRVGLVMADGSAWWVGKGCFDVSNCIVGPGDVMKVITPGAVPKKYLRYLKG